MTLGRVSSSSWSFGKIGVSFSKFGPLFGFFGIEAVDGLDLEQAVVLFRVLGRAHLADHQVAGAQAEAADLALRDIDIFGAGQQVVAAQEADIVLDDLQDTAAKDIALLFGDGTQEAHDEVILLEPRVTGDIARARQIAQVVQVKRLQLRNRHLFQREDSCVGHTNLP